MNISLVMLLYHELIMVKCFSDGLNVAFISWKGSLLDSDAVNTIKIPIRGTNFQFTKSIFPFTDDVNT